MVKLRMSHFTPYRTDEETPGQIQQIVRLRIKSGSATSGPPIGPVLGQYAIPISKFCTEFNERTIDFFKSGVAVFVTLHYLVDGSYCFTISLPITSICFSRAVQITQSTGVPSGRHNTRRRCRRTNWRRIGALTQYMLFEVVRYRTALGGTPSNTTTQITFSKCVGTVRSVGIVPYKYKYNIRKRIQKRHYSVYTRHIDNPHIDTLHCSIQKRHYSMPMLKRHYSMTLFSKICFTIYFLLVFFYGFKVYQAEVYVDIIVFLKETGWMSDELDKWLHMPRDNKWWLQFVTYYDSMLQIQLKMFDNHDILSQLSKLKANGDTDIQFHFDRIHNKIIKLHEMAEQALKEYYANANHSKKR